MDSIPLKLESKIDIFKDRKHSNWRLFGCRQQKMRVTNGTKCSAYGISQFIFFGFRTLFVVPVVSSTCVEGQTYKNRFHPKKRSHRRTRTYFSSSKKCNENGGSNNDCNKTKTLGNCEINRYYTNTRKIQPLEFIER